MITVEDILKKYSKIVIWGGGKRLNWYNSNILPVNYVVDSDPHKWGKSNKGIMIHKPDDLLQEDPHTTLCIINSIYWKDILKSFESLKIQCDVILNELIVPNPINLQKNSRIGYSLFGEDVIIHGMTERYGIPIKHYIDIGCNHPIYGNATYAFYAIGADGICIEPNPKYTKLIKILRRNDVCMNVGVSEDQDNGSSATFYNMKSLDSRSTLDRSVAEKLAKDGLRFQKQNVFLRSLNSICEEYMKHVDYISIDVESREYSVLKDFFFEKFQVEFFNIEKGDPRVKKLLLVNKYELVSETPSNWIFAKEGLVREKEASFYVQSR